MPTYHINIHNRPAVCSAEIQCRRGGKHFPDKVKANLYLAASELIRNGGSFSEGLTKEKRRKIAASSEPMKYNVQVGESVLDVNGDEWKVVGSAHNTRDGVRDFIPTVTIEKVRGGEQIVFDPYDADNDNKIGDYRETVIQGYELAAVPSHVSEKFKKIGKGTHEFENVVLERVEVLASLGTEKTSRFIIVQKPKTGYFSKKSRIEIGRAMWEHAGRDVAEWDMLSEEEQERYSQNNRSEQEKFLVENNGNTVTIKGYTEFNGKNYLIDRCRAADFAVYEL